MDPGKLQKYIIFHKMKLSKIIKMHILSRNELEQIVKKGVLKNTGICQKKDY